MPEGAWACSYELVNRRAQQGQLPSAMAGGSRVFEYWATASVAAASQPPVYVVRTALTALAVCGHGKAHA